MGVQQASANRDQTVILPFLKPMECVAVKNLPTGKLWTYEIKLDGFRVQAVRNHDRVTLYSKQGKNLTNQFLQIALELENLPSETILDGEVVALDENGVPRFNLLQNYRGAQSHLMYFAFDILVHQGADITKLPYSKRRKLLTATVKRGQHVQVAECMDDLQALDRFVREHRLEGIVAKRKDSRYEPGRRTGAWVKLRHNCRQEFVVGGYTPSHLGVDALLVGVYEGSDLRFAGSVRAGLNPPTRRAVREQIKHLEIALCPFTNLPDKRPGVWGQGITAAKMKDCIWLRPTTVVEIEFAEWTADERLRHAAFVGMRHDKAARKVTRES